MNIQKIITSTPSNSTAQNVLRKGYNYEPAKKIVTSDSPFPIALAPAPHNAEDLTGRKFGRFTVLGYARDHKGWVVKCVCGIYTTRRGPAIRNPNNKHDRCETCRHLEHLKDKDYYLRTGKDRKGE